MLIAMIVAMDEDGVIGDNNGLPWELSSDMARFKSLTEGNGHNAVIMGRKTWKSLPDKFRPLPSRVNIVMSKDSGWKEDGAESALYPGRAIEIAYSNACEECWIIGGSQIYDLFFDSVTEIHVTRVHTNNSGQIFFPTWNREQWIEEVFEKNEKNDNDDFDTTYSIWKKK